MKAKEYTVLVRAVEEGVAWGWARAYKHNDAPSEQAIKDSIEEHVMQTICEWFDFEEKGLIL